MTGTATTTQTCFSIVSISPLPELWARKDHWPIMYNKISGIWVCLRLESTCKERIENMLCIKKVPGLNTGIS